MKNGTKNVKKKLDIRNNFIYKYILKRVKATKSTIILFHEFMIETKLLDYKAWLQKDDKNLYTVITEYMLSNGCKYLWYGLLINFAISCSPILATLNPENIISCAIAYWFLMKVLITIKQGER